MAPLILVVSKLNIKIMLTRPNGGHNHSRVTHNGDRGPITVHVAVRVHRLQAVRLVLARQVVHQAQVVQVQVQVALLQVRVALALHRQRVHVRALLGILIRPIMRAMRWFIKM